MADTALACWRLPPSRGQAALEIAFTAGSANYTASSDHNQFSIVTQQWRDAFFTVREHVRIHQPRVCSLEDRCARIPRSTRHRLRLEDGRAIAPLSYRSFSLNQLRPLYTNVRAVLFGYAPSSRYPMTLIGAAAITRMCS